MPDLQHPSCASKGFLRKGRGGRKWERHRTNGAAGRRPGRQLPGWAFLARSAAEMMALWALLAFSLGLGNSTADLDPSGRNVCPSSSHPTGFTCCPGWKQEGKDCPLALCLGRDACHEGEVCVRPGVCRCRPGFFGANCFTRCPDRYWGPDCKESCLCHPHGKCDPASGACSCHPNRWGPLCQFECRCGPRGHCNPHNGTCRCDPGWWAPECRKQCSCNLAGSRCDPVTGLCSCQPGWWGKRCSSRCSCNGSPCAQDSGRCQCLPGWWGAACQARCGCQHGTCASQDGRCACHPGYQGQNCEEPCSAGAYGDQCQQSCGHCRHRVPCSPVNGFCPACDPGWTGTRCEQPCPTGSYGENCSQPCPNCHRAETCHPATGKCQDCEAGLLGDRCDTPCPSGLFGEGCQFPCPPCSNGTCDPVSGICLCQPEFWGPSCNQTCPEGFQGPNCSEPSLALGYMCHLLPRNCRWGKHQQSVLLASLLVPVVLFTLCICFYCCCGRKYAADGTARSAAVNLVSGVPCLSLGAYRFPRVTVAHHDTEMPFNPSFIEAPSAAWPSDSSFSSSFDMDDDGPAAPLPAGEAPEAEPFAIPRTSSIAKAKRPSVSFAEGTRFAPRTPSGSMEILDVSQASAQMASLPQPAVRPRQDSLAQSDPSGGCYENVEVLARAEEGQRPSPCGGGHRKRAAISQHVARRVKALEAASRVPGKEPGITTIYVTVGKAGGSGERPAQSVLHRLGSLQRGKRLLQTEPRARSLDGLPKAQQGLLLSEEDGGQQLSQSEAALSSSQPGTTGKRGTGPLGGLPAPTGEDDGMKLPPGQSRREVAAGRSPSEGVMLKEDHEPKYENLLGWSGCPCP